MIFISKGIVFASLLGAVLVFWINKFRSQPLFPLVTPIIMSLLALLMAHLAAFASEGVLQVWIVYGAFVLSSRFIGSALSRAELRWLQKWRDRRANNIDGGKPFILYLRPFNTTDRLSFSGISSAWGGVDLEVLIDEACRRHAQLICLGRWGEAVGAGRISVPDSDWQHLFLRLAQSAKLILIIPSANDGTFYEMSNIRNSWLSKTMFIMPPATQKRFAERIGFSSDNGSKDYAKEWQQTSERATRLGLMFPLYSEAGGILEFAADGKMRTLHPFDGSIASIMKILQTRVDIKLNTRE